jgi:hypothetical protein
MAFPTPDALFAPLAARIERRLPPHPAWLLPAAAGTGLGAAAVALALHHHWVGAGLLLAGLLAAGLETAGPTLSLGLLALPFGFGLADPSRALAAMFLMFALTVLAVLRNGHVSLVTWLVAAVLLAAAIFPNHFSLLAYLLGITCFVSAGQGVARRLS